MSNGVMTDPFFEGLPKTPKLTDSFFEGLPKKKEDSFGQNFIEGFEIGRKGLVSGVSYLAGDVWQMFSEDDIAGEKLKIWAEDYQKTAPQADDSWGQFIGSLVPSTAGVATGIAVGTVNPAAGYAIGQASVVGLTASSAGQGMMEYDQYKREIGEQSDALERIGVGVAYGVAEYAMERVALNKFMPVGMRSAMKSLKGNTGEAATAGKRFVSDFIKKNPTKGKDIVSKLLLGSQVEGAQEAMTELVQSVTDMTYQKEEDWNSIDEVIGNMGHAYLGGAIMGTGLGGLSYKAQDVVNNKRRKEQGFVRIGKMNNEGVEIIGMNNQEGKMQIMYPDGNTQEVDPNLVTETVDISPDQFRNLLKGKTDETNAVEKSRIEAQNIQKQQFDAQFEGAYRPGIKQAEDGTEVLTLATIGEAEMVVTDETTDGESVYVVSPETGGAPRVVAKKDLDNLQSATVEEWKFIMAPELQVIPDASLPAPVVGEEIEYTEGPGRIVSYDAQTGEATIEYYRTMKNGDTETVPISPIPRAELDNYRKFDKKAPEQVAKEANVQAEQFDEDGKPVEREVQPEQQEIAPIELELEGRDEPIVATAIDADVYEVGGKKKKEATDLVKTITEEYPNLSVEVVDKTDKADPMAKSNFVVQIKTKKNDKKSEDSDIPAQQEGSGDQGAIEGVTGQEEVPVTEGNVGVVSAPDIQAPGGGEVVPGGQPGGEQTTTAKPEGGKKGDEDAGQKPVESRPEQSVSPRAEKEVEPVPFSEKRFDKGEDVEGGTKFTDFTKEEHSKVQNFNKDGGGYAIAYEKETGDTYVFSGGKGILIRENQQKKVDLPQKKDGDSKQESEESDSEVSRRKEEGQGDGYKRSVPTSTNAQETTEVESNVKLKSKSDENKADKEKRIKISKKASPDEKGRREDTQEKRVLEEIGKPVTFEFAGSFRQGKIIGEDEQGRYIVESTEKWAGKRTYNVKKEAVSEPKKPSASWQKTLPEVVEETKKVEPRLENTDESNIATEYVNPMGPKNKPIVEKEVAKFKKRYPNAPEIVVMESHLDLQLAFPDQPFENLHYRNAFFNPIDGKAYLVASAPRFKTPTMVEQSLLHEVIGHYGVRKALDYAGKDGNKKFNDFMGQVFEKSKNDPLLRKVYEGYANEPQIRNTPFDKLTDSQKVFIAEEYVAHVAETNTNKTLIQEIVDWFRNLVGIDSNMTDDMVRDILANGRRMVEVGDNMVDNTPIRRSTKVAESYRQKQEGEDVRFQRESTIFEDYENEGRYSQIRGEALQKATRDSFRDAYDYIGRGTSSVPENERIALQHKNAKEYAEKNGLLIKDLSDFGTPTDWGGMENRIAVNLEKGEIYKSNNLFVTKGDIQAHINYIQRHNFLTPITGYELVGFQEITKNKELWMKPVVKQAYIRGEEVRKATQEEIDDHMKERGYYSNNRKTFSYKNGVFEVSDLKPANVLYKDGELFIVDNITKKFSAEEVRFQKSPPTDSKAFKDWFGDSKVVDENGEPLVVYHGSPDGRFLTGDKAAFMSISERYSDTPNLDNKFPFFFTNSISTARSYMDPRRAFDYQGAEPMMANVYLSIKKPLEINAFGLEWNKFEADIDGEKVVGTYNITSKAIEKDYDGIIIKNVRDNYNNTSKTPLSSVYVAFQSTQIKSATGNQGTFDPQNPDIRFQKADPRDSKGFRRFRGEATEYEGSEIQNIKSGEPVLIRAYHGTTNEFYEFDSSVKGNIEGHLGRVNYFTSDVLDAEQNYQSTGADLTSRIENLKERVEQDLEDIDFDGLEDQELQDAIVDILSERYPDFDSGSLDFNMTPGDIADRVASRVLDGGEEKVMELYIKLNNPIVLGNKETWFETLNVSEEDLEDAAEQIADEYGIGIEEAKEDYQLDIQGRAIENTGYENLHVEAMADALYANGYDSSMASDVLGDDYYESEVGLNKLEKRLRSGDVQLYDNDEGELASSQVIADFFKNLGYDGIILTDVSERFTQLMQGFGDQVSHIHVFDEFSNQIKLASGENTTFDEGTKDIRFQVDPKDNFYSNSLQAIRNVNQGKATGDQWKAMLLKNGASQSELDWIGFDDFLKDNPKPSKEEVYNFIKSSKVEVFETKDGLLMQSGDDVRLVKDTSSKHKLEDKYLRTLIKYAVQNNIPSIYSSNDAFVKAMDDTVDIVDGVFETTPPIRQKALKEGLPMFQKEKPMEYSQDQYFKKVDRHVLTWQDRYIYLKRLQDFKRKQGREITDDMNAYDKENLSWGKINEQDTQFKERYVNPLDDTLMALKGEGLTYEEASRYLKAKHIFTDQIENGGIPIEEAGQIVSEFESKASKANVDRLINNIKAINSFVLEKQMESGMLTKAGYDRLQSMHEFYVPLRGFADLEDTDKTIFTKDYKRKGRTSESGDPIPYLMVQAQTAIVKGEQNKTKQALLEFVKQNPDSRLYSIRNAWYLTDTKTGEVTAKYTTPTSEEFNQFDVSRSEPLPENMTMEQYKNFRTSTIYEQDALTVMVDGKKIILEFTDSNITATFKKQNIDRVPRYLKWGNVAISYLRKAYTQYSPEFGIRNFIRDMSTGMINVRNDFGVNVSGKVFKNMPSAGRAVKRGLLNRDFAGAEKLTPDEWVEKMKNPQSLNNGELMRLFLDMGGLTGYSDLKDVSTIRREMMTQVEGMKDEMKAISDLKRAGRVTFKYTLGALDNFNRVTENIMRFSTFKTLIEEGMTPQKAAIYAKDVTVNFNRKGTAADFMGSFFLFWNASIQGIERLARPFVGSDKTARRRAMSTALMLPAIHIALSMMNRLMGGEDDDGEYYYDKLSEYDKTHNLIVPNPLAEGKFFRIPLPYGYNVFFAWPAHVMDALQGRESVGDAVINTIALGMESFSPLGAPQFDNDLSTEGKAAMFFAPTIGKTPLEVAFNTNFMGLPIYKEQSPYDTPRPESEMHFNSVDPIMKAIAANLNRATGGDSEESGWIDLNPEVLEHYAGSYSGGLGKFLMNSMATMVNLSQHGAETFTTDRVKDVPFVRNYVTHPSPSAYRAEFYTQVRDIEAKQDIYNRYKKSGNKERTIEYRKENINYLKMANMAKNYREQVKKLNDLQKRYENMGRTEDAENVEEKLKDLYTRFNKQHKNAIEGRSIGFAEWLGL